LAPETRAARREPEISREEVLVRRAWASHRCLRPCCTGGPFCDAGGCRCCRASGSHASLRVRPIRGSGVR